LGGDVGADLCVCPNNLCVCPDKQSVCLDKQAEGGRMDKKIENWKGLLICSLLVVFIVSCKHIPQKDVAVMSIKKDAVSTCLLPAADCLSGQTHSLTGQTHSLSGQTHRSAPTVCSVPMFTNESHQYGLEEVFTNLLIKEIVYDGQIDVAGANNYSPLQPPDITIKGRVISYERSPISYGEDYINRYRLSIKIEMTMLNRSNEVMEKKVFEDSIDFVPTSSPLTTTGFVARGEDEAAQELCQRICCRIVSWIVG